MFKGKAIYNPKGAAQECSEWACNFYVGCSNNCSYCYLKKGIGAKVLGGCNPELKKCFADNMHAMEIFEKEMRANLPALQKHGLFFSFTTDPMLPETKGLTWMAMDLAVVNKVPVKILTKMSDFADSTGRYSLVDIKPEYKKYIAIGFTLTGHDELEPNASPNYERIDAMIKLHDAGFKTFASIEPIIHFESSLEMIRQTIGWCDLYKIGLLSGKKPERFDLLYFICKVRGYLEKSKCKVYFKNSITDIVGNIKGFDEGCFVERDYNVFIL